MHFKVMQALLACAWSSDINSTGNWMLAALPLTVCNNLHVGVYQKMDVCSTASDGL